MILVLMSFHCQVYLVIYQLNQHTVYLIVNLIINFSLKVLKSFRLSFAIRRVFFVRKLLTKFEILNVSKFMFKFLFDSI